MRFFLSLTLLISFAGKAQSDSIMMRHDMAMITKTAEYRNYEHMDQLNEIALYIFNVFAEHADTTYYQTYLIGNRTYRNVIGSFGTQFDERIIVGAHYDVCGEQEGADDNASGVVGLLEIARQLKSGTLNKRIDLVAFTLEEPPFFRTDYMGSFIHAQSLAKDSVNVKGMVCLEMIGYFDDAKKTQRYPIGALKLFYGSRGNYITLVNKFGPGSFARSFTRTFRKKTQVKAKQFKGPKSLPGIDFSDHMNYWHFGYSAVMVTDTAFYRNGNYHGKGDTMEKLDFQRMAKVVDAVLVSLTAH